MLTERQARIAAQIAARTGIDMTMIDRLVRTFYGKVRADAAHFIARAEHIALSLEMGIAVTHGVLLTTGARFRRPDSELAQPA